MKKFLLILSFCLSVMCLFSQENQHYGNFSGNIIKRVSSDYLIYLPDEYSSESRELWPLLIFLHGSGERGNDLELVKKHGPPMLVNKGKKFPFIILSPQCRLKEDFDSETLFSLIEHIVKEYKVDKNKIYLTGLSMGGWATWDLAMANPDYFAAIAPVCGSVNRNYPERATELKGLPIWAFHGAADFIVPIDETANMVSILRDLGNEVKFTIYPTTGHDAWTETYNNPELYDWFLKQSLGNRMAF